MPNISGVTTCCRSFFCESVCKDVESGIENKNRYWPKVDHIEIYLFLYFVLDLCFDLQAVCFFADRSWLLLCGLKNKTQFLLFIDHLETLQIANFVMLWNILKFVILFLFVWAGNAKRQPNSFFFSNPWFLI